MKHIYYLSTCRTCRRIMSDLNIEQSGFRMFDSKFKNITEAELEQLHKKSGLSYEDLFNKRALKYKKDMFKTEDEFKQGILSEYTFIKRPIIVIDDEVFVGNAPNVVDAARDKLGKSS